MGFDDNLFFASMAMPKSIPSNPLAQMMRLRAIRYMSQMGRMPVGPPQTHMRNTAGGQDNPFTMDPAMLNDPGFRQAANNALGQYGLSLPSHVPQYAMIPETPMTMAHPRLFGALESGLFGFANTDSSGTTTGDQIAAGIRGAIAGHAQRNEALMNPYLAPFQMAGQMENLRDLSDQHQLRMEQIKNYQSQEADREARIKLGYDKNDVELQKAQLRNLQLQQQAQEREAKLPSSLVPMAYQLGITDPYNMTPEQKQLVGKEYAKQQAYLRTVGPMAAYNAGVRQPDDVKSMYAQAKQEHAARMKQFDPSNKNAFGMAMVMNGYDVNKAKTWMQQQADAENARFGKYSQEILGADNPVPYSTYGGSASSNDPFAQLMQEFQKSQQPSQPSPTPKGKAKPAKTAQLAPPRFNPTPQLPNIDEGDPMMAAVQAASDVGNTLYKGGPTPAMLLPGSNFYGR